MTDIGNPIPRGTIETDAPLVDEALAAREQTPSSDAADTVSALKDEIDHLKSLMAERQAQAASQARAVVRDHPIGSLFAALLAGYAIAAILHGRHSA